MQQLVAELTRPMVLSDRTLRQLAQLKRAHVEFMQRHGREPTGGELASDLGLSREQVSDLLAVERLPQSLDEPVAGPDGELGVFGELVADPLAGDAYEPGSRSCAWYGIPVRSSAIRAASTACDCLSP
jgi:RNA polymerase primary sigma factor